MNLKDLKKEYNELLVNYEPDREIKFVNNMSKNNDPDVIAFHYKILSNKDNLEVFKAIRASFNDHDERAKYFLLDKLKTETNQELKAETLFILGAWKPLDECDKEKIRKVAIEFIDKKESYTNEYYGIIVLGWIGGKKEISILEKELLSNENDQLRLYSATALRQIFYKQADLKNDILKLYYTSLKIETEEKIVQALIACIQDLVEKKFGIKESMRGVKSGNIEKAKPKTLKFLEKELL
ncbi:HEAT repeat domain-containing protein [Halarcobacter sp.]|uniref:HEAT repeat domain-containing protein n=1 Tax=Halarcobacter sp. TaxID=2321133 RepID=UPI0029F57D16|nr:HEAT repeat domain-containing protein [Halarcobacter sp.]